VSTPDRRRQVYYNQLTAGPTHPISKSDWGDRHTKIISCSLADCSTPRAGGTDRRGCGLSGGGYKVKMEMELIVSAYSKIGMVGDQSY
jgi:hypothetical protein